ncbi:MAG: alanine racemase [Elusimicrobia bacterium RIFOXYA12_FULL_51_18]|nr:MAG: alanine racemase [Elusimicrobia bacterium RIFOXYA12_FULL_51_18]OGS32157.1 MAG: alanine racemase [Elusimicrobia bacterium RIFOXYA2_FULL_53_38]
MIKWIEIDLGVVKNNVRAIKATLAPGVKLMAVVKADAYGHGALEISKTALSNGADMLGTLTLEEAALLRSKGVRAPITALAPAPVSYVNDFITLGITPTADSLDFIKALDSKTPPGRKTYYHIDIDSGLKRWGVEPNAFPAFLRETLKFKRAVPAGISTHISYVPDKNMIEAEEKLSSFKKLGEYAKKYYPGLKLHAANSSVLCDFPHWQLDMARIGNLLYGLYPSKIYLKKTQGPPIKGLGRPWRFYARVISIKTVKKGESLGYASDHVSCKPMTIATVPVGYADGLTLEPSEKSIKISGGQAYWGLINGLEAPFVGRAAIAHTLLDITGIPGVKTGAPVLLPIRRTAASARIPRIYK